jgi:hypothetical protein
MLPAVVVGDRVLAASVLDSPMAHSPQVVVDGSSFSRILGQVRVAALGLALGATPGSLNRAASLTNLKLFCKTFGKNGSVGGFLNYLC